MKMKGRLPDLKVVQGNRYRCEILIFHLKVHFPGIFRALILRCLCVFDAIPKFHT